MKCVIKVLFYLFWRKLEKKEDLIVHSCI